jgi:hypothetical protein
MVQFSEQKANITSFGEMMKNRTGDNFDSESYLKVNTIKNEPEEDEKTEEDLEDEPTPVANNIRDFIKDNIDRVCKDIKSKNPKMPQAKIHGAAMVELQKLWHAKNMK